MQGQEEFYSTKILEGYSIKRPIVVIVIGYIIGIIWGLYINFSIVLFYILIYILKKLFYRKREKKFKLISIKRYFRYIKLIFNQKVIFIMVISSIISNTILIFQENRYETLYKEENIKIEGIIISNQQEREYKNRYTLKVLKVNNSNTYKSTQIFIEVKKDIILQYGDRIICEGIFSKGSERRNKGGFDYQLYLKSIKKYGTLDIEKYKKISENQDHKLGKIINDIKIAINQKIEKTFDGNTQQIVKGLILGDTTNLEENLKANFQIANISHVLAVSGMHVIYIIIGIEFALKKILGKRTTNYIVIVSLLFYMCITGFTSSIVRAGIMAIINILTFLLYRKKDIWSSIAISLFIILIENPYAITGIGLQLSYLGTIGIILFNKSIKQFLDSKDRISVKIKRNNLLIKRMG